MNKYIFAATLVAFTMLLAGCKPEEEQVESHEVEVLVSGSVTGAFTKAVSIQSYITDFEGALTMMALNERFDGAKTSFERSFKMEPKPGESKTASVGFTAIARPDVISYKDEPSPWSGECHVTVMLDGRVIDSYGVYETETHAGMTLIDGVVKNNWAAEFAEQINRKFGLSVYTIEVNDEGVNVKIK